MKTIDRINALEQRLAEAFDSLWNGFVDPREPFCDDGERWLPLAGYGSIDPALSLGPASEVELADIRQQCRWLALENEFAINGHENRISFIVGSGHNYRATPRKGSQTPPPLVAEVQRLIDEFVSANHWHSRQQEIVRRKDRDGEAFLRFFIAPDGGTRVRFVEPDQVLTPPGYQTDPSARLGVLADRHDVETVLGYFVDGHLVDAAEIQHRKANVDANVRRGLPLFYPVRKNLRRAEKLLRNMSVVAEIQSAIALFRKHRQGTASGVQQFVANQADHTAGYTRSVHRYGPGTILDAHAGVEYDFPAAGVDAANFVVVLQAELRAIASRLVMPEFMLTSDASNANYASTMVAEGPAMRMFERLQAEQVCDDLLVMRRVIDNAVAGGRLPADADHLLKFRQSRHRWRSAINCRNRIGIASSMALEFSHPQTWSQLAGFDYDQEQTNIAAHANNANPAT